MWTDLIAPIGCSERAMPSKSRTRRLALRALAGDSAVEASVDLTAIPEVPLRRGEIPRYRELRDAWEAGRPLDAAETSELLGYLVRRVRKRARDVEDLLGSVGYADDELRAVAGDLASRRADVVRLLRDAGLATRFAEGEEAERRAREVLLRHALRRGPGLVAGSGAPREELLSGEEVVLEPPAHRPGEDDVPVYFHLPSNVASARLREALAGTAFRVADAGESPPEGGLVINWGSAAGPEGDAILINPPEAVRGAADKLEAVRRLGDLAPPTVVNPESLSSLAGGFVAKSRAPRSPLPAATFDSPPRDLSELALHDYFQEAVPARRELRVTLLNDDVVSAYERTHPGLEGLTSERSLVPLERLPLGAVRTALEARRRVGLDLAGVDLVQDDRSGQWKVLELNSAPGLGRESLQRLYALIQRRLRSG